MAIYRVEGPDGQIHRFEGPDGATPQQVEAAAAQQFGAKPQEAPYSATEGINPAQLALEGVGKGMMDLYRGAKERLGLMSPQDVAAARNVDAPLMKTGAGTAGVIAGNIAGLAPAMVIPGANTVAGAAAVGALSGALQPTTADESALRNTLVGGALGGASQAALGAAAKFAGNRLMNAEAESALRQGQNAVKDQAIKEAKDIGYKTVPSISDGSLTGRLIEGASGKVKAQQLAAVKNQNLTDALVRRGLGLPEDAPLSADTMRSVRQQAAQQGYDPVRAIPSIKTDNTFRQQVSQLTSRADNAAKDFGGLVDSDVKPLADGLKAIPSFSGDTAVDAAAIFREKASDFYSQGNKTLGAAYRKAAEAVEGQIERGIAANGKPAAPLMADFRAARTRMAQTFDVEKALREGQGSVDARALGKIYAKNPQRMTGEIAQVGRTAAAMPDVMAIPKAGWANPITAVDSGFATFGGILAGNPAPLAFPLARAAGRYGLMSDLGQKMFTTPNYAPGMLTRGAAPTLEELQRLGVGGLLGPSVYAAQ